MQYLEGDREAAEAVLKKLIEEKYIDDFRYACAFARDKSSIQGWGAAKIKYMLSSKGISSEDIAMALDEVDPEKSSSRLDKLLIVKKKALKDDPQGRLKLLRFALGRGYGYDEVVDALKRLEY